MITILREKGNEALIRKDNMREIGGGSYETVRYEWWTNKEKMQQGIPEEEINGIQYIYCRGFAGVSEENLKNMFDEAK
jgi:hypothetical protein